MTGTAAAVALAGCGGSSGGDGNSGGGGSDDTEDPESNGGGEEFGGWFTEDAKGGAVDNFDGSVADETGSDAVTVEVGSEANGGTFGFTPPAVRVSPGTTVTFEWTSNTHNVLVEDQPDGGGWGGVEAIENEGYTHEFTFDTEGTYKYYCDPHLSMGMKGAVVVG